MTSSHKLSRRRLARVAVGIFCLCTPVFSTASASTLGRGHAVAPERVVALMFATHTVFGAPAPHARALRRSIAVRRPITGERTVLPVLARRTDSAGTKWLKVMLPGRPNSSSGWIHAHDTRLTTTLWHLIIDLSARSVTVYFDGRQQRVFRAVIGKPSTPTPTGRFFVEETLKLPADDPGGPFALALSARSNVFRSFDGGPGQIAVHGRDGLGGTLGDAQSHGCIRLADAAITWLARWIGPGVPVTIDSH